MTEDLFEKTRDEFIMGHDWLNESLLIELDLSPEFSWGRLAETRMCQFETAMTDIEAPKYPDDEVEIDNSSVSSFYIVDEVYISSSDES